MNRNFTLFFIALLAFVSIQVNGQTTIIRGIPKDSTVFSFPVDSPLSSQNTHNPYIQITLDTTGTHLWQIGNTSKPFFADTGNVRGIMTDTSQHYPLSANDYFILKLHGGLNPILSFWHKYQTTAGKDGCIIEFSNDNKATWQNIAGDCLDTIQWHPGIHVQNTYGLTDTLLTGEPAFSGSSNGWQLSQIQFFTAIPIRTTGGSNCNFFTDLYVRFRFVSDTASESLDGWIIGNIKVNDDDYGSGVNEVKKLGALKIFPNPVTADVLYFPELPNADRLTISVYDVMGKKCLQQPYQHTVNVSKLPAGVYSYRVNDDERQYSGRIVIAR